MLPLISVVYWLSCGVGYSAGQLGVTRACGIQIVADSHLWQQFLKETKDDFPEAEGEEHERLARHQLVSLAGRLVNQANSVLEPLYLGNAKYKLLLKDVQIETVSEKQYGDNISVEELLNLFSYTPRDSYCLSYLITYLGFPQGRLGLAFTATNSHGGVCEKFRLQKENVFGYEREVNKSLNTGVVSLNRNNRRVSERVAALTFSHEIGHSLGASHDPLECEGDQERGNFLMFRSGSLGTLANNMRFSSCSIKDITSVLNSIQFRDSGSCWSLDSGRGTCGNSVVEVWEECDCGSSTELCERECCVPPGDALGRKPCTLVTGAQCSPSEGTCCNSTCQYSPPETACSPSTECTEASQCTGLNSYCPLARQVADSSPCGGGSRTCQGGVCKGSICPSLGKLSCNPASYNYSTHPCSPHCHTPDTPCSPAEKSFPDGVECGVDGTFGYCERGICSVRRVSGEDDLSWLVGVIIFLVFYLIFSIVFLWFYCRYCRRGTRKTLLPVRTSGSGESNCESTSHQQEECTNPRMIEYSQE